MRSDEMGQERMICDKKRKKINIYDFQSHIVVIGTFDFNYYFQTWTAAQLGRFPLASMVSVFYQPSWHSDLFTISLFGYQMFELLDRIVTAGTSTHQQANLHFYFWACCITVIVGGIAKLFFKDRETTQQNTKIGS